MSRVPRSGPSRRQSLRPWECRRGILDGALPTVVFVAVNALAGLATDTTYALRLAIVAATTTGVGVVALRVTRGEPLKGALRGLAGLAVAILFAAWKGQARDFFLPGIYVDAAYGVVFFASALVGRPLVGYIYAAGFRQCRSWRYNPRLRRVFTMATLGWSAIFVTRAVPQTFLYGADRPDMMAVSKLLLGWPVTVPAVALTLAAARWAGSQRCRDPDHPAR